MSASVLPEGLHPALLAPALAVTVGIFWILPRHWREGFLAAASFGIVAAVDPLDALVLLGLSLVFFHVAPRADRTGPRRWIPSALVLGALVHLAWFKYIPPILAGVSPDGGSASLVIPLGISYYTFKLVHYAIETARGNLTDRSLPRFLCYVFLFPTFTAGPIERYGHFLENREPHWSLDSTVIGLTRILHGLVKKFVLAASVWSLFKAAGGENLGTHLHLFSAWRVWGFCGLMYLYLYLDFSAYSDLAIGASRLFGIGIMENFNWPMVARNIGDFWFRWHMTLADWCRSYVYMPALGLTRSPYRAAFASFAVIGLWHAGALPFLLWGLYHATGICVFQAWRRATRKRRPAFLDRRPWCWIGILLTNLFVASSFAITMGWAHGAATDGLRIYLKLFGIEIAG